MFPSPCPDLFNSWSSVIWQSQNLDNWCLATITPHNFPSRLLQLSWSPSPTFHVSYPNFPSRLPQLSMSPTFHLAFSNFPCLLPQLSIPQLSMFPTPTFHLAFPSFPCLLQFSLSPPTFHVSFPKLSMSIFRSVQLTIVIVASRVDLKTFSHYAT